jgi:hypothetical protein
VENTFFRTTFGYFVFSVFGNFVKNLNLSPIPLFLLPHLSLNHTVGSALHHYPNGRAAKLFFFFFSLSLSLRLGRPTSLDSDQEAPTLRSGAWRGRRCLNRRIWALLGVFFFFFFKIFFNLRFYCGFGVDCEWWVVDLQGVIGLGVWRGFIVVCDLKEGFVNFL